MREVECLYEVWKITAWKDEAVYKTENTNETRWLTQEEVRANHPKETNTIFAPMPTSFQGRTVRVRGTNPE